MMPATVHGMIPAALAAPGFIEHHRGFMPVRSDDARQVWRSAGAAGRRRYSPPESAT